MVGVAQHLFPEAAPCGQQRVVGDEEGIVFVRGGQPRALQVAGQLALVGGHALGQRRFVLRLLAQHGLADHAFDVGV